MSGYSAIGKKPAPIAPRSMMMIEITQARTGRSIKKRASMGVTQWVPGLEKIGPSTFNSSLSLTANARHGALSPRRTALYFCSGHLHKLRLDFHSRTNLRHTAHHDALTGLEPLGNLAETVMHRPGLHRPGDDFVFVVHDIDHSLSLVVVQRPLGHEQRWMRAANRHAHAG